MKQNKIMNKPNFELKRSSQEYVWFLKSLLQNFGIPVRSPTCHMLFQMKEIGLVNNLQFSIEFFTS